MNSSEFNSLTIILIYGTLISFSFLKITNPLNVNKKGNFWFGVFLLLWSSFWIDEVMSFIGTDQINRYFNMFIHFIQFFTPAVFYLSVVFFTNPIYKFRLIDLKYLLFPILFLAGLILQSLYGDGNPYFFELFLSGIILLQALIYTISSYLLIRKHQKNILLFASNTKEIDLNWLEYIISLILLLSIIFSIYALFLNGSSLNLYINILFLIVIFIIGYYLQQKEIFPLDQKQRKEIISINEYEKLTEIKKKIISDEELASIKEALFELMRDKKTYLDSEINLIKLADLLNITSHQLSYIINSGFNENFFHFINKYRVEKAKELLANDDMNYLSILGIAFESGFNSKTSFNTTFKKITNLTPSEFKKSSTSL